MRVSMRLAILLALVAGLAVVQLRGSQSADAAINTATYFLSPTANSQPGSSNANTCVDASDTAGARLATCELALPTLNQLVALSPIGLVGQYQIRIGSGRCLAAAGASTASGAVIVPAVCSSSAAHLEQRWRPEVRLLRGTIDVGMVTFRAAHSGLCLDVPSDNRDPLVQRSCSSGAVSAWFLTPVGANLNLTVAHSGKCLDVNAAGGTADGVAVQQWDCLGPAQTNQLWRLHVRRLPAYLPSTGVCCPEAWSPPSFQIRVRHSNKCLTTNSTLATVDAVQMTCASARTWTLRQMQNYARYEIRPDTLTGPNGAALCLEITGGSLANGARARHTLCNGGSHQQWAIDNSP